MSESFVKRMVTITMRCKERSGNMKSLTLAILCTIGAFVFGASALLSASFIVDEADTAYEKVLTILVVLSVLSVLCCAIGACYNWNEWRDEGGK